MGLGAEVSSLLDKVGLDPLLKAKSVFERLYYDALDRLNRLEELQTKHQEKKEKVANWRLMGFGEVEPPEPAAPAELVGVWRGRELMEQLLSSPRTERRASPEA